MRKSATIELNPDENIIYLEKHDISTIEILDCLKMLMQLLSSELMTEYCKDRNIIDKENINMQDFEGYVEFLRNQKLG